MKSDERLEQAYSELLFYTLAHAERDAGFIHQLAVDAWTLEYADEETKPMKVAFALIGMYLHVEKGFSGKQVQEMHVRLARKRRKWPVFEVPEDRGEVSVFDVLAAEPGEERDEIIERWCEAVWGAWEETHEVIAELMEDVR